MMSATPAAPATATVAVPVAASGALYDAAPRVSNAPANPQASGTQQGAYVPLAPQAESRRGVSESTPRRQSIALLYSADDFRAELARVERLHRRTSIVAIAVIIVSLIVLVTLGVLMIVPSA